MMQNRRAAPVSKVFTIPAKNKVQKAKVYRRFSPSLSLAGVTGHKKQNHRPRIPWPFMGVRHSQGEEKDRRVSNEQESKRALEGSFSGTSSSHLWPTSTSTKFQCLLFSVSSLLQDICSDYRGIHIG